MRHTLVAVVSLAVVSSAARAAVSDQAQAAAAPDFSNHAINKWVLFSPTESEPIPRWGWEGSAAYDEAGDIWIHHGGHAKG